MKEPKLPEVFDNINEDTFEIVVCPHVPNDWVLERVTNHAKRHFGIDLWIKDEAVVIDEPRKRRRNQFNWSLRELQVMALGLSEYCAHLTGIERKLLRKVKK